MEESLGSDPKGLTLLKSRISFLITYQGINFYLDKEKQQIVIKWKKKNKKLKLLTSRPLYLGKSWKSNPRKNK